MTYKGNLTLEWYNKNKPLILTPTDNPQDKPAILNWVNKDGALFYEIDESQNRGLRPEWTDSHDFRVRESRPLVLQKSYEAQGDFMSGYSIVESDDPKANTIIRGDNLLALNTLVSHLESQPEDEKVKCIYIDPPYNTQQAFDKYDDNLEHSQWLTMMRDRLVLMRKIMREDGVIFVQCDDNEQAYLKVLMDEIFGRQNFINTISVNMKNIAGASGGGEDKKLKKNIEYILMYTKNYDLLVPFENVYDLVPIYELVEQYRQEEKSWKYTTILYNKGEKEYLDSTIDGDGNEIKIYKRINPIFKSINTIMKEENLSEAEVYLKYSNQIFQTAMPQSSIRPRVMSKVVELKIEHDFYSIEYVPKTGRNKGTMYEQFYKGESFRLLAWLKDVSVEIDNVLYKKEMQGTYWDFVSETKNLSKEGQVVLQNSKKPEKLIQRILEMSTKKGDIVFDAFGGSGTTFAVAHKMNRRYIGIEVGEHADTLILPRLQKVMLNEDKGGITKSQQWQGGGAFSYYHLGDSVLSKNDIGSYSFNPEMSTEELCRGVLRYFDAPMTTHENGWAYGHNGEDGYLICLENDNITIEDIENARVKFCPNEKPYFATVSCISASDDELDKFLLGTYRLPYKLQGE